MTLVPRSPIHIGTGGRPPYSGCKGQACTLYPNKSKGGMTIFKVEKGIALAIRGRAWILSWRDRLCVESYDRHSLVVLIHSPNPGTQEET